MIHRRLLLVLAILAIATPARAQMSAADCATLTDHGCLWTSPEQAWSDAFPAYAGTMSANNATRTSTRTLIKSGQSAYFTRFNETWSAWFKLESYVGYGEVCLDADLDAEESATTKGGAINLRAATGFVRGGLDLATNEMLTQSSVRAALSKDTPCVQNVPNGWYVLEVTSNDVTATEMVTVRAY